MSRCRSGDITKGHVQSLSAFCILHSAITCASLEWARQDSNLGPTDYEPAALTAELRARTRVCATSKCCANVKEFDAAMVHLPTYFAPCTLHFER